MSDAAFHAKIRPTQDMLDAGESVIWSAVEGADDLGGWFSARELAEKVFLAMLALDGSMRDQSQARNLPGK